MLIHSGKLVFSSASALLSDFAWCSSVEIQQMTFVFPCPSHHTIFVMPNTLRYIGRSSSLKTACLRLMQASQPSDSAPKSCLASWWGKKNPVPLKEALGSQWGNWLQYPLEMVWMKHTKFGFSHLGLMTVGLTPSLITLQSQRSHCWHCSQTTTRLKDSSLNTTGTLRWKIERNTRDKLCLKTAEVSQDSGLRWRSGEDSSHCPSSWALLGFPGSHHPHQLRGASHAPSAFSPWKIPPALSQW